MIKRRGSGKGKSRKRISGKRLTYAVVAVTFLVFLSLAIYFYSYTKNSTSDNEALGDEIPPKAAIVDQLSSRKVTTNYTFFQISKSILESAGFERVDYYNGSQGQITVNFYRNFPSHLYGLVIFRVHSAVTPPPESDLCLFTSELYNESLYSWEQENQRLARVYFTDEEEVKYFGIAPKFVKYSMKQKFQNAIIIMMGCDGLKNPSMAEAFVNSYRGAKVYISWDGLVGVTHSDNATIHLLKSLLVEKRTIKSAVNSISPDPTYDPMNPTKLKYYPSEAANYSIPKFVSALTTNTAETNMISLRSRRFKLSYLLNL